VAATSSVSGGTYGTEEIIHEAGTGTDINPLFCRCGVLADGVHVRAVERAAVEGGYYAGAARLGESLDQERGCRAAAFF